MQDLRADNAHWIAKARAAGPGWRVWRWEEPDPPLMIVWKFRLLAPGEPVPDEQGVVIPVF